MTRRENITQYPILNDQEAPPAPAGPYCVLKITEGINLGHSGGTPSPHTEHSYDLFTVAFHIHARAGRKMSAKARAIKLATQVMQAFDDAPLDLYPSRLITWTRVNDFGRPTDDNEHEWVVVYELTMDKLVKRSVRRKIELR